MTHTRTPRRRTQLYSQDADLDLYSIKIESNYTKRGSTGGIEVTTEMILETSRHEDTKS
ncbi:PTH11-like integral membrane protein [Aspergillus clavatus NRRL 1]|uniref:Uncharacterized protein n=1 Tax=Aspergillus clavatus (strain ATCC 1007 / CBS 513.65 / DSM 816 / NCTC 3887 / NRRL 1 / QM 1276 / 107) TaxID=344612 RepID=A1CB75_ASPCL|nr:uncharacterized protein ACLA_014300 [Aspergillus clavatus NRRL 1]EAW12993.1 hypothetical protein ACLA_014300 [Aspergillus clavatus NRRL 1]